MKGAAIVASLLLGLVMVVGWGTLAYSADVQGQEAPTNQDGEAYELNRDPAGFLWLSDYTVAGTGAGEVWQINPTNQVYTIYGGIAAATDARGDGDGAFWWVDYDQLRVGRLGPGETTADIWELSSQPGGLYGSALDDSGRFWAASWASAHVYSLDPAVNEACAYEIPSGATADYLATDGQRLYFGTGSEDYFYALDPISKQINQWSLPAGGQLGGVTLDSNRHIWYADYGHNVLARLEPEIDALTTYTMPAGTSPVMIDAAGHNVWYSEDLLGSAGLLRPDETTGFTTVLDRTTGAITPTCAIQTPITQTVTISTGVMAWETATYTVDSLVPGYTQYALPSEFLWGVAAAASGAYVVDYGRQMLVQLPVLPADITACKLEDADGDLGTAGDQTPVEGFPLLLITDGVPAGAARLTGDDGCTRWLDLATGSSYTVQEQLSDDWQPLTPISVTLEPTSGAGYNITFINTQKSDQNFLYLPLINRG